MAAESDKKGSGSLLVFGGETEAGQQLARRALAAGYTVVLLCCRPLPSGSSVPGLTVRSCDVLDRQAVQYIVNHYCADRPAVAAILGGSLRSDTQGNMHIIDAAVAAGLQRFILTTSIGCGDSAEALDPLVRAVAGRVMLAKSWAERHLRQSGLDWTIIRAGGQLRRPPTGGAILTESRTVTGHITVTDLGDMLFEALCSPRTLHRVLAAVDRGQASSIDGSPVLPAEL